MRDPEFKKILADHASDLCRDIQLDEPALQLLTPDLAPVEFLRRLMEHSFYSDAVKLLARALPKREATWWACLCVRHVLAESADRPRVEAVETAERWVYQPTEENRRAAYSAAQSAQFDHPASWAAMAAFWSGGSMAPPDAPPVSPADNLTAKAAAGAIMLAAVMTEPEKAAEKYRVFLRGGIDIACGGNGRPAEGA